MMQSLDFKYPQMWTCSKLDLLTSREPMREREFHPSAACWSTKSLTPASPQLPALPPSSHFTQQWGVGWLWDLPLFLQPATFTADPPQLTRWHITLIPHNCGSCISKGNRSGGFCIYPACIITTFVASITEREEGMTVPASLPPACLWLGLSDIASHLLS